MQGRVLIALTIVALVAPPLGARAQTVDDPYTIMRPEPGTRQPKASEPWLAPKYQSPRGTQQKVKPRRTRPPVVQAYPQAPPPIYVPETGRLLPNLPALPGAGPGGRETAQDRALRCQHQAGVYGDAAGNREAYVGGCINQQ
ncbi:MAG: hypothetical protein Q8M24_26840 [Pseudolabrys sp.]|nr:hypothetical protein [Pseudolabrys sp.]MDP2299072.1 hypothetical protein [Pseudolabrys sp.]